MKMAAKWKSDLQKDVVQKEAVTKIVRHFKKHDRGQLAMFCGTGKTRTAIKAIRRLKSRVVVVCVPTLGLVSQWLKDFAQHGDKRTVLAVCSKLHNETPEQHGIIGATTDKAAVRAFARHSGNLLIVSTYHSYDVIQAAWMRTRLEPIDLLIADEAHNTAGRNSKHMGLCLHDKGATVRKRLFMTATRRLYRGEKQEYNCMDDTEIYGDVVYELTIREAIDRGILADYEVHVINVYKDLSAEDLRNINKKGFESGLLARFVAQNLMAEKRVKVFTFHNRVADATKFSEQVAEHGQWSRVLTGEQRVQDREQVLQEFRDEAKSSLIASVNVLGEGIDAPTVDVVVFADRMTEPGAIQQRMGRGTRMATGKRKLRIILPICVSPKMSDSEVLQEAEESQHKDALHVIRALASYDAKFYRQVAEIDLKRRGEADKNDSESVHIEEQMLLFDGAGPRVFDVRLLPQKKWPELEKGLIKIESAVWKYLETTGRTPSDNHGAFLCPNGFHSWASVSAFLETKTGHRLSEYCVNLTGVEKRLSNAAVKVVDAFGRFVQEHGRPPKASDTEMLPKPFASWREVRNVLKSIGTSLSKLAAERGFAGLGREPNVSESRVFELASRRLDEHVKKHGKLPRCDDKFILDGSFFWFRTKYPEMYRQLREHYGKALPKTRREVVDAVVAFAARNQGRTPSVENMKREHTWCRSNKIRWTEIIKESGLAPLSQQVKQDRIKKIMADVVEFVSRNGKRPTVDDMCSNLQFVRKHKPFGIWSWPAFVDHVLKMKEKCETR